MMRYQIDTHEVAPKGVISDVIAAYRRHMIPMTQLLSDYAAVYLGHGNAVNPWAARQKEMQLPYERGATIAETLMLTQACKLKKHLPTDIMNALFYNVSNSDLAVECDVLRKMLAAQNAACGWKAVINPSPDFLTADFSVSGSTYYFVPDPLVAELYRKQFRTNKILSFDEMQALPKIGIFLVMQRQYPDVEKLLSPLQCRAEKAKVLALLPHKVLQTHDVAFWNAMEDNGLYICAAARIDSAVLSEPKKKTLLSITTEPQETVALWDSKYDAGKHSLELFDSGRRIAYERFRSGGLSMLTLLNGKEKKKTDQVRKPATEYHFTDEIALRYTVKEDQSGTPKIKAAYYAITDGDQRRRGQKLTRDVLHRIGTGAEEEILENIPFEPDIYESITTDIKRNYAEASNQLTLKTCWFLCKMRLEADQAYNHEVASELFFQNNELARIKLPESTEEDVIKAVESVYGCGREQVENRYWRQLDLIIRKAMRGGYANANPIERFVSERSTQLTPEQREVRDALVKKTLEPEEIRKIVEYLSSSAGGEKCYSTDSRYVAGWIKLVTGMTNAEICALLWDDYIRMPFDLGHQLRVTKRIGENGTTLQYGNKERDKIRSIPIVAELKYIIDRFYSYVLATTKLSKAELGKTPMIPSADSLKCGDLQPMTISMLNRIVSKMLESAAIDPHKITLHDGAKERETDLHEYKGDFFRSNAYFFYRHVCNMPDGEACYLTGKAKPTTFYRNYVDFANDFMQYRMAQEIHRGLTGYDEIIGLPSTIRNAKKGLMPMRHSQLVSAEGKNTAMAQLLFCNGCQPGDKIRIESEHGLCWNCSFVKEAETK